MAIILKPGCRQIEMTKMIPQERVGWLRKIQENEVMASAVYDPRNHGTAKVSMLGCHEALGHPRLVSILFLEQRRLIKVK